MRKNSLSSLLRSSVRRKKKLLMLILSAMLALMVPSLHQSNRPSHNRNNALHYPKRPSHNKKKALHPPKRHLPSLQVALHNAKERKLKCQLSYPSSSLWCAHHTHSLRPLSHASLSVSHYLRISRSALSSYPNSRAHRSLTYSLSNQWMELHKLSHLLT